MERTNHEPWSREPQRGWDALRLASVLLLRSRVLDHFGVFRRVLFEVLQAVLAAQIDVGAVGCCDLHGLAVLAELFIGHDAFFERIILGNSAVGESKGVAEKQRGEDGDSGFMLHSFDV